MHVHTLMSPSPSSGAYRHRHRHAHTSLESFRPAPRQPFSSDTAAICIGPTSATSVAEEARGGGRGAPVVRMRLHRRRSKPSTLPTGAQVRCSSGRLTATPMSRAARTQGGCSLGATPQAWRAVCAHQAGLMATREVTPTPYRHTLAMRGPAPEPAACPCGSDLQGQARKGAQGGAGLPHPCRAR
jgi:hypothetical protein